MPGLSLTTVMTCSISGSMVEAIAMGPGYYIAI
jgi:hypothetical protein